MRSANSLAANCYRCDHCGEYVMTLQPQTHSNRCALFGGHTAEKCSRCGERYLPAKGWKGNQCTRCAGQAEVRVQPATFPDRRTNIYVWGPNGMEPTNRRRK